MVTSTAFISAKLPRAALTDNSLIQATTSLSNDRAAQGPPDFFPETKHDYRYATRCRNAPDRSGGGEDPSAWLGGTRLPRNRAHADRRDRRRARARAGNVRP